MKIGEKLKNINFIIGENEVIKSTQLLGKKTIIYFYPKDDAPGCTKEAIDFSSYKRKFEKLNTQVIGISKDSIAKHNKFKLKHKISVNLASDEDISVCKKFKVWIEKSMYGKKYMGIERSTFLIDEKLILIKLWKKVKVKDHVKEVYEFISNSI